MALRPGSRLGSYEILAPLGAGVPRDRGPAWAPDGSEILSYSDRGGTYELWAIHPDGSGLRPLTHLGGNSMFPIWSPDGTRVATAQYGSAALVLGVAAPGATTLETLPNPSASLTFWPSSWSRDGARLLGVDVDADGNFHNVLSYAFATRSYESVWKNANSSTFVSSLWLADDRRALVRDRSSIYLVDTRTKEAKRLLSIAGAMIGKSVGVTRDNRWITYSETATEGDIWLMTLD